LCVHPEHAVSWFAAQTVFWAGNAACRPRTHEILHAD
jgi:hypothetical protein